jgi:hypothetical protein
MDNIFAVPTDETMNNISGKLTYTNVMEIIPDNYVTKQIENWKNEYDSEWRWRFLKFNGRSVVEVSYVNKDNVRMFCDKYGNWISNVIIDKKYDDYVVEAYYVYVKN